MHSECTCGRLPHASGCPFFAATEQVFLGNRFTPCPACAEKDKELERLRDEKKRRVYYQDIVYAVCNTLDTSGEGRHIICGTVDEPSIETQEAAKGAMETITAATKRADDAIAVLDEFAREIAVAVRSDPNRFHRADLVVAVTAATKRIEELERENRVFVEFFRHHDNSVLGWGSGVNMQLLGMVRNVLNKP